MPDKAVYCPRCQLAFTCNAGNIDQCFCRNISLHAEEIHYLSAHYSACLCRECLRHLKEEIKKHSLRNPKNHFP